MDLTKIFVGASKAHISNLLCLEKSIKDTPYFIVDQDGFVLEFSDTAKLKVDDLSVGLSFDSVFSDIAFHDVALSEMKKISCTGKGKLNIILLPLSLVDKKTFMIFLLDDEHDFLDSYCDITDELVVIFDRNNKVKHFNARCAEKLPFFNDHKNYESISLESIVNDKDVIKKISDEDTKCFTVKFYHDCYVYQLVMNKIFSDGKFLGTKIQWIDITGQEDELNVLRNSLEEKNLANIALDVNDNAIVVLDRSGVVVSVNKSANNFFKIHSKEVGVKSGDLIIGNEISHYIPNILLNEIKLQRKKVISLSLNNCFFNVTCTAIFNGDDFYGVSLSFVDVTQEVQMTTDIERMVSAAEQGDFTMQLPLEGKSGGNLTLTKGLNNLSGTIETALNDIARVLGAVSRGTLTERITRDYKGAFSELKSNTNNTIEKLTSVIHKISGSAKHITSSAQSIAAGNNDLSSRTDQQASSLEVTATSMEEITTTVRQSSENANKANELSSSAQEKAVEGGRVVSEVVEAMRGINESSKKINDIIGVIDEIAFQTNLLALNAAVEAARAGEQGRGFAVVAGEVRNLAQRSAAAAKEIKTLIKNSVSKVDSGTKLVNQSGKTLADLVESVKAVSSMMSEISSASKEQTSGIEQVNASVSNMDEMTQKNAELVHRASLSGNEMAEQAAMLIEEIAFFSIDESYSASLNALNGSEITALPTGVNNVFERGTSDNNDNSDKRNTTAPVNIDSGHIDHSMSAFSNDDEWEDF